MSVSCVDLSKAMEAKTSHVNADVNVDVKNNQSNNSTSASREPSPPHQLQQLKQQVAAVDLSHIYAASAPVTPLASAHSTPSSSTTNSPIQPRRSRDPAAPSSSSSSSSSGSFISTTQHHQQSQISSAAAQSPALTRVLSKIRARPKSMSITPSQLESFNSSGGGGDAPSPSSGLGGSGGVGQGLCHSDSDIGNVMERAEFATAWEVFIEAESPTEVLESFALLGRLCTKDSSNQNHLTSDQLYDMIKHNVSKSSPKSAAFFKTLDTKKNQNEYVTSKKSGRQQQNKVLVCGSGPGGLRAAIECCLLGCQDVVIIDKRAHFSRHNLLHIWPFSIRDLKSLGGSYLVKKFCTGLINHIAIRRLQALLSKLVLLLGAKIIFNAEFSSVIPPPPSVNQDQLDMWSSDVLVEGKEIQKIQFNILIGADGESSRVGQCIGFDRKVFQGGQALGVTANFPNTQTREEASINEFGLLAIYNQPFFNGLKDLGIHLENLVYYREETHYFVMTPKKESLIGKGVIKSDNADVSLLLTSDNVSKDKLKEYVKEVSGYCKLPSHCSFTKLENGSDDVQLFDFSKKHISVKPSLILNTNACSKRSGNESFTTFTKSSVAASPEDELHERRRNLLVILVGDALVEPFWPQGTGANRAILSAYDASWMIKNYFEQLSSPVDELTKSWEKSYKYLLSASTPDDLLRNVNYSIDPSTRYTNV